MTCAMVNNSLTCCPNHDAEAIPFASLPSPDALALEDPDPSNSAELASSCRARTVASLSGRAKPGLQDRRRRNRFIRRVVVVREAGGEEFVEEAGAGRLFVTDEIWEGFGVGIEVEIGVEINHVIKWKSCGVIGVRRGEPRFKERSIR